MAAETLEESSPRAWGWTADDFAELGIGENRPHARGGGPVVTMLIAFFFASSPRAWGWTGCRHVGIVNLHIVPTRVGVDPGR